MRSIKYITNNSTSYSFANQKTYIGNILTISQTYDQLLL